jgi:hypothetical protein
MDFWSDVFGLVDFSTSIASAILAILFLASDYRFEVLRLLGMTRLAVSVIHLALFAMALLSIGFAFISLLKEPLSFAVTTGILAIIATGTALFCLSVLMWRPSFTWTRYGAGVVVPLATPLVPFGAHLFQLI